MSRLNLLGIFLCVGAGCIVLFESIGAMMTAGEIVFKMSSPVDLLGEHAFAWIERLPWLWLQNGLHSLFGLPAWSLVLALGVLCFIISGLRSK